MLTSIVILTFNELEYTQRCVESIRRHTPEPHELVLVDNGSTDGTVDYLRGIEGATVIANERNAGFGGGCNQGIAASRGERIMLLNNDTVVTEGWLAALHAGLDADPARGIVGPRSNHVAGIQVVPDVDYDAWTLDGLEEYAAAWSCDHRDHRFRVGRVIGFCMLIERAVIDRIGGFDLRFGLGNFEDDDICMRTLVAGFEIWVCDDAYVHHFGSRTFAGAGIKYQSSMRENLDRFCAKWGVEMDIVDGMIRGYHPGTVAQHTRFDEHLHYAPLVARPDTDAIAQFERRGSAWLVPAVRDDAAATAELFAAALANVAPADDVTLVVRLDPRHDEAIALLGAAADEVGASLPDIVVVEHDDDDDAALVRACDLVLVPAGNQVALTSLARFLGTPTLSVAELAHRDAA